jgi:hypothetical protein
MSLSLFARKTVIRWWLVVAAPAVVFGQTNFTPSGPEYPIAGSLPGDQVYPAAAINANGGYLVWQDNSVAKTGVRIRAARLNDGLTVISNFLVSSVAKATTTGDQEKPQVALLNGGGAVVVWQGGKHGFQKTYARFIGPSGKFLLKQDVRVSAYPKYNQINPQVVTLTNGTVVIVWASDGQDGSMLGVFARLFSPAGKALGPEFQVNQYTSFNQRTPGVAALASGNYVIVWISELQRGPASVDAYARQFSLSGPLGNEFPVNTDTNVICANPSVAASPQGGFAVAWSQQAGAVNAVPSNPSDPTGISPTDLGPGFPATVPSSDGWDVFGTVFDTNGVPVVPAPFRWNAYTYGDQYAPRLSAVGSAYLAMWTSLSQQDSQGNVIDPWEGVFGQFITPSGTLVSSSDLHVNTTTVSRQIQPAVASDGVSRFLVVWSSFVGDTSFDLFAQQFLQTVSP